MLQLPIKILVLAANPSNTDRLRLGQEVRDIEHELLLAKSRDCFELISKWAVRVDDLTGALLEHNPQIVHFSGHGGGHEGLALEDDDGNLQLVETEPLAQFFKLVRKTVQCVVLNACYSQVQAAAVHQHIDCVIGMNKAIGDKAAIQFATKFYQALAAGRSFQDAYDFACAVLNLSGSTESTIPILLNRNETENPLGFLTPAMSLLPETPDSSNFPARQSQSVSNITSGNGSNISVNQSGRDIILNQSSTQSSASNIDLQAALDAIAQLKQAIASSPELNPIEKKTVAVPIDMLESELRKPQPDKSLVDQAIATLKKTLDGVVALAKPITKVAALVANAWGGLL
ncbi:MAG: CHAT domain-containing protein [Thainema sp.]